jgi:hypothetical protein
MSRARSPWSRLHGDGGEAAAAATTSSSIVSFQVVCCENHTSTTMVQCVLTETSARDISSSGSRHRTGERVAGHRQLMVRSVGIKCFPVYIYFVFYVQLMSMVSWRARLACGIKCTTQNNRPKQARIICWLHMYRVLWRRFARLQGR